MIEQQKKSVIITFDLHGVIFARDYKRIFFLVTKPRNIYLIIQHGAKPRFLKDSLILLFKKTKPAKMIYFYEQKYPRIAPLILKIANSQKPLENTCLFLTELQNQGFELHVFSNIGSIAYKDLAHTYPAIFKLFENCYVPSPENNFTAKPNMQAFTYYNAQCNPDNKQVIFIDDKKENIKIARSLKMHAILFKTCADLQAQLNHFFK